MSLFIGNISRNVRTEDLEDEFDKFGPCTVKVKVSDFTKSKSFSKPVFKI
jgi:RNA recognition motif-containing protein